MLFKSYHEDTRNDLYDRLQAAENELATLRTHIANDPNKYAVVRKHLKKELKAVMQYDYERRCWYLTDTAFMMWDKG